MRATFRAKLIAIVVMAALSFAAVVAVSSAMASRVAAQLTLIRDQYVPQLELGPHLEARFDALRRGLQDAVAANDMDALIATEENKSRFLERLAAARSAMPPEVSATLRASVEGYYAIAYDVSRRLIQGETGESIVEAMARMQEKQTSTTEYLKKATAFDRAKLVDAFNATLETQAAAFKVRIWVSVASLGLLTLFCFWVTRGSIEALTELTAGLGRFGKGDFAKPIRIASKDELGDVTAHANTMAENLRRNAADRDSADWQKAGIVKLSEVLRGELGPDEAARRTVEFLVQRMGAAAGALYLAGDDGVLRLRAHSGLETTTGSKAEPVKSFRLGEGLVGRAAASAELTVVKDLPAEYLRVRSGLGESEPRELVLLPLTRHEKTAGVLELAFLRTCSSLALEFLSSVHDPIVITLEAAGSRAALHELLEETRQQAEKLAAQEEELRANNEELVTQQGELRQANEELEAHRRTLAEQNAELEEAKQRVQQKAEELTRVSAYKSQFLANMSHELRTPLNSMLLLSQLLASNEGQNLTPKQVEYCRTVHSAGKDLLSLINQILDLAKIEAGRQELYVERVFLQEFADHARSVFTPLATDKGLSLVVELSPGLPAQIATDRHRVERIVTNLIGNAIKFTNSGEVRLSIKRPDAAAQVRRGDLPLEKTIAFAVSDTGIGIAREAQEQVFAPFEQLESKTDRRYGGTGLGLAIARESANLLGGELQLVSEPGKGSVFTVYLPESSGAVEQAGETPAVDPNVAPHRSRGISDDRRTLKSTHPHLLVIEDDTVFAEQLVDVVRARKLQVLVARTGEEGLSLARAHKPQGIILDVRLPDIDGWAVMERLRNDPETRSIPVHFISSVDNPERGFALGAIGYLTKPTTQQDLVNVVRTLAPRDTEKSKRILVVEDHAETGESVVQLLRGDGLEARHVADAKGALGALAEGPFGCMILDLGLPDMDGLGLLETLKGRADIDMPPVLVYTARSLTKEETRRLEAYVEAVVMKDGNSEARLLEELRLFVGHLKDALPKSDRPAPPDARSSDVSLRGAKILLADDDMRTVYALSALLRGKGADVIVADTGREALALLAEHPDVSGVLMDVMMPEMDGYEAMRQLRREARFERLPVIALTAKAMKGERERCLEAGASDYLAKPVDGERLLATLGSWLEVANGSGRRA